MRFDSTALDPALVGALADKGFHTAFPIQELTLEMGIRGQDIIGQARTGTGKTLGFGLPVLHRIDPDLDHIQALIVAPTRELTAQVAEDLQIGAARGIHVTAVYGGVPIDPQFDELKKAHVVVGTPGRLLDHLNRGTMDLSRVTELVLDEADEMLDMGFLPDVERLMSACPPSAERHTSLFSATMAPAIVSLARRYMDSPSFLHAKSDEPQTAELVEQHFFLVHRMDKPRLLARIMQQPGREGCYVFSRTKAMCDRLVTELEDLGVAAIAIHGDLRQATREKNLDKFREGKASILVATEVAARGLDVDNVTHVVNYDCPDDDKMYLHRIGRTARAGRSGVAVTFAEHNEIEKLNVIRKAVGAYEGDLPQMFSTSPELKEIFDLPDETPWDHLAKRGSSRGGSSKGGSSKSSSKGGSSRGGQSRDDSRGGQSRDGGRNGSSRGKGRDDRDRQERDDRPARKPRAERDDRQDRDGRKDRDGGRDRQDRAERDEAPARKPRDRARSRGEDDTRTEARDDRNRSRGGSDRGDAASNGGTTRTRTRTRVRTTGDDRTSETRDRSRDDRDGNRGRDDRGGNRDGRGRDRDDRGGRSTNDDDRGRDSRDRDGGDDQPKARPRARRRARGGRGHGGGGSSDDRSSGRGDDRDRGRSEEGRSRQSQDRNDRSDRNRGGRDDDRSSGGRSSGGRNSGGRNSGSRSSNGRNSGGRSGGRSGSTRTSTSSQRQATRTTADRRTKRGEDARGEGQPRLARRVEVENLP